MKRSIKTMAIILTCLALASCGAQNTASDSTSENCGTSASASGTESKAESTSAGNTPGSAMIATSGDGESVSGEVSAAAEAAYSIPAAADMFTNRDLEIGYSDTTDIIFSSGKATVSGTGAVCEDGTVTITAAGTYLISGTVSDGRIIVDADGEKVQIVLDNANITFVGSAALYVKAADKVFVTTAEGSVNTLASTGEFTADGETNVDGAVFAKSDITFNGAGTLTVSSEAGHGIVCKDDLKFTTGTYSITAAKKGIDCKESVRMAGGTLTITSGTDGIHAENTNDPAKGFVYIAGGKLTIVSGQDGIDASGDVTAADGTLDITSGGGSASAPAHMGGSSGGMRWDRDTTTDENGETVESCKGIKSDTNIVIGGGYITIDANDDALHSNASLSVTGGTLSIKSGDDGIHAEDTVLIADGNIDIAKSYEGIEGEVIEISGGAVNVIASDDGMNAAGGESTGMMDTDSNAKLTISGGNITVNADGDGLDTNGYMYVTGGTTYVSGPTNSGNGALDYGISGTITGGTVIAAGSSGMAENFGKDSTQGSILYTFDQTISGGTGITLTDESGNVIASFTPEKNYQSVVISAPGIESGKTYTLTAGDKSCTVEMTSLIYGSGNGFGGGFGGRNEQGGGFTPGMNGEMPQMPEGGGFTPGMNGEMPQMPEGGGFTPGMNGEMPQMPEGGNWQKPQRQDGTEGFYGRGSRENRENAVQQGIDYGQISSTQT